MPRAFLFDAYGTLFDVHAAIGRHRDWRDGHGLVSSSPYCAEN